jgi:DNA-binding NarL/FixJ family response regulator
VFSRDDSAGSQTAGSSAERVLIIEDDFLVATEMEAALRDAGLQTVGIAASAREALELAVTQKPHLAVVDIRLAGGSDGVEAAVQLLRAHGIRCVFATAHADADTRARAAAASPLGWLQKPYTMASLVFLVRDALSKVRRNR